MSSQVSKDSDCNLVYK